MWWLFLLAICQAAPIKLYVNFYVHSAPLRQIEINTVFIANLNNTSIDNMYVAIESQDAVAPYANLLDHPKVTVVPLGRRPTFADMFHLMHIYSQPNDVSITANSDIYFDETLELVRSFYTKPGRHQVVMALTRYDVTPRGLEPCNIVHSQDTWIVQGSLWKYEHLDFHYGLGACDCRLAYELRRLGYTLINPMLTVRTLHLHESRIRSWYDQPYVSGPHDYIIFSHLPK